MIERTHTTVYTMAAAKSSEDTFLMMVKTMQDVDIAQKFWCRVQTRHRSPNRFRVGAVVTTSVPLRRVRSCQHASFCVIFRAFSIG